MNITMQEFLGRANRKAMRRRSEDRRARVMEFVFERHAGVLVLATGVAVVLAGFGIDSLVR